MQYEQQNIDDLFRNKENELVADTSHLDAHWKTMRKNIPSSKPKNNYGKYLIPVAAAALIMGSVAVITEFYRENKTTVAVSSPVKNDTSIVTAIKTNPPQPGGAIQIIENKSSAVITGKVVTTSAGDLPPTVNNNTIVIGNNEDNRGSQTIASVTASAEENARVFEAFMAALKPTVQSFTINNERDTLIQCEEGTKLFIPARSFETLIGSAVSTVKIEVTEHYNYADIIGNKLTTLSGENRLSSGGMIHLKATSDNSELRIKNGKALNLKMPGKVDHRMELFTGKEDKVDEELGLGTGSQIRQTVNWIPQGQRQLYYDPENKKILIFNLGNYPQLRYKEKRKFLSNEVISSRSVATFHIPFDCRYSKTEIKTLLEEKYGKYYDEIKVKREWKPISKKRQQLNSTHHGDWSTKYVGDSVWIPIKWAMSLKFITREDSLKWEEKWKKDLEERIRQNKTYKEFLDQTAEYNFSITNLGWINCDRFLNYPNSRLTEFVISTDMDLRSESFSGMLIFKEENSVMRTYTVNGNVRTDRIPVGEPVTFVGITVKEGKVYTCIEDLRVSKAPVIGLEFKPSTAEEFKAELRSLGTVITN